MEMNRQAIWRLTFIENAKVEEGTVYVIPYTNRSGMTHNDPQEASPQYLNITTPSGVRKFRYGLQGL